MGEQFGMRNGMQAPVGTQIQVDLSKTPQMSCACGCKYFAPAVTVHIVSALLSPTGQELIAQVPVLLCMECKAVMPLGKNDD